MTIYKIWFKSEMVVPTGGSKISNTTMLLFYVSYALLYRARKGLTFIQLTYALQEVSFAPPGTRPNCKIALA